MISYGQMIFVAEFEDKFVFVIPIPVVPHCFADVPN